MKILVDYNQYEPHLIMIENANYLSDYAIRIKFNDDTERVVDFKPFLTKSHHPSIKKYLDENYFSKYRVIDGNLNWNDYDMIFPILDLYNGKIEA